MRVLGVDPGITVTGYGVVSGDKSPSVITAGEIKPDLKLTMAEKLDLIFRRIEDVIGETSPDAVAAEGLFYSKNAMSVIKLGHARGIIFLASARAKIPIYEYSPREVKSAATGYGGAEKGQVEAMIKKLFCLTEETGNHMCDALAVALCHIHTFGSIKTLEGL